MDVESIQRLFVDAMSSDTFTRYSTRAGEWNIAGQCDDPQTVVLYSRQTGNIKRALSNKPLPGIELTLKVVVAIAYGAGRKRPSIGPTVQKRRSLEHLAHGSARSLSVLTSMSGWNGLLRPK